ncbi:MAG: PKD domain-containing protein [Candidatus Thermoplasmatota archaeon]
MLKKILLFLIVLSIFFIIENNFNEVSIVSAKTIDVDGESIQDAINNANESDTIYVHSGTYNEKISINKKIILKGEEPSSTIISYSGEHTIEIHADSVEISNLKILNTDDSSNSFSSIFLDSVSNCEITNNYIENSANGIYLVKSNSNNIENNNIKNNNVGIYFSYSDNNVLKSNIIKDNNANGVSLSSTSANNILYLNDFANNIQSNARDLSSSNQWSYQSQGNYWDDYNGYDTNNDGIGDSPYVIDSDSQDNYPLGYFNTQNVNHKPTAYIDQPTDGGKYQKDKNINFEGHGTDPDEDDFITSYRWVSNIDGQISISNQFQINSLSTGEHTIYFSVKDNHDTWSDEKKVTITLTEEKEPIATISSINPNTAKKGQTIYFNGYGQDPDGGNIIEYQWRSDKEGILSKQKNFQKSLQKTGKHTIYFKVKDDENEWSTEDTQSIEIKLSTTTEGKKPIPIINCQDTGYKNISLNFDGSQSSDPDGSIKSYYWDFGDSKTTSGKKVIHKYTSGGFYNVTLTVTDNQGNQNSTKKKLIINPINNGKNNEEKNKNNIPGFTNILLFLSFITILLIITSKRRKR